MTTFSVPTITTNEVVPASVLQAFQDSLDAIAPIGSYLLVHMTPPADGTVVNGAWLGCSGQSVSATTYVKLFNTIGTVYGGGAGSFNLPDFRGRTPLMTASGGHSDASLGKNDGAALASRRPKHSHTVSDSHAHTMVTSTTSADDSHTHSEIPWPPASGSARGTSTRPYAATGGGTTGGVSAAHFHNISGSLVNATTAITAVGVSGLTDGPSFLVCCTVLMRAL